MNVAHKVASPPPHSPPPSRCGMSPALACACCSFDGPTHRLRPEDRQPDQRPARTALASAARPSSRSASVTITRSRVWSAPVEDFTVTVARLKDRITFSLRDAKDRAGTLSLVRPQTISIFEVDPRDTVGHRHSDRSSTRSGRSPPMSPATASSAAAPDRTGASRWCCTDAAIPAPTPADFKHWTLEVHGRGAPLLHFLRRALAGPAVVARPPARTAASGTSARCRAASPARPLHRCRRRP